MTTATSATGGAAAAGTPPTSLSSLTSNFSDFLGLLMTQLKNQDPTSPMDTNQFTSQLVQFSSVEQQINTNTSLNTLIQATQGGNLLQASSLVGQQVDVSGDQVSLQSGKATLAFNGTAGQPVTIKLFAPGGAQVASTLVQPTTGSNSWSWDGTGSAGQTMPDGPYKAVIQTTDGGAVPFTPRGTVTGVQRTGTDIQVQMGGLSVDLNTVQALR